MKKVPVKEAVGKVLAHDLTKIEPGKSKGARFKKGHKITREDIPELLQMGKENIYIYQLEEGKLHEDEGAKELVKILKGDSDKIEITLPSEGKISLKSKLKGLLKVNKDGLKILNSNPEIVAVTCYDNQPVSPGEIIAETKIVPLVIDENEIFSLHENILENESLPLIDVFPFINLTVSMIVTGSEVYHGRVEDGFAPVVKEKIEKYGSVVKDVIYLPDEKTEIKEKVISMAKERDLIVVSGGMSVDPDDVTPSAIKETGAEVVTYGAPLLPGTMLMLAYYNEIPIIGLPGCVMYERTTAFDVFLPRVFAGIKIHPEEISSLGHGGLCFKCRECGFPKCGFGLG